MGKAGKVLWRVGLALLWLFVALLCVEVAVRAQQLAGEYDAKSYMARWYEPVPLMRPATAEEAERLRAELRLPQAVVAPPGVSQPHGPVATAAMDPLARYRQLLEIEAPDDRNAHAALDGDCWLVAAPGGEILHAFGDPDPLWLNIAPQGMAGLEPGGSRFIKGVGSPLWDYETTHLGQINGPHAGNLYRFHNTSLNLPLDELEQIAQQDPESTVLVPSFALKPNLSEGMVISDQFGFPNRPVLLPKPGHTIRILCFGGSTTYESDVGTGRTTEYLQQMLQESISGWTIEVINCGIAGATSLEMRRRARDYVAYQPDLIIYYEGINDTLQWLSMRYHRGDMDSPVLQSAALRHFFNRSLLVEDDEHERFWQRVTRINLVTIATAARDAGIPFMCASFAWPRKHLLSWREANYIEANARTTWGSGLANYATLTWLLEEHNRHLKRLCEEKGWGYLPFGEQFHYGLTHFHDMCHFNQVGRMERARRLHAMLLPWVEERIASFEDSQR